MGLRGKLGTLAGALAFLVAGCSADGLEPAADEPVDSGESAIAGGRLTHQFKGVGFLILPDDTAFSVCTASLIATGRKEEPYRVLTAAHCVLETTEKNGSEIVRPIHPSKAHFILGVDDFNAAWTASWELTELMDAIKKLPGAVEVPVTKIEVAGTVEDWKVVASGVYEKDADYFAADVATLGIDITKLPSAYRKAALPVSQTMLTKSDVHKSSFTTVGFGSEMQSWGSGTGFKRAYLATMRGLGRRFFVTGSPGRNDTSCYGDSGGPVIRMVDNRPEIVGVTATVNDQCKGQAMPARVDIWRDFIVGNGTNTTEIQGEISGCGGVTSQCLDATRLYRCIGGEFAIEDTTTCVSQQGFCGTVALAQGGGARCMSAKEAGVREFVLNDFEREGSDMLNYLPSDQGPLSATARRMADKNGNHFLRLSDFQKGFADESEWGTSISLQGCDNHSLADLPTIRFRARFPEGRGSFTLQLRGPTDGCDGENVSSKAVQISAREGCGAGGWQDVEVKLSDFKLPANFYPRYIRFAGFNASSAKNVDIDNIRLSAQ